MDSIVVDVAGRSPGLVLCPFVGRVKRTKWSTISKSCRLYLLMWFDIQMKPRGNVMGDVYDALNEYSDLQVQQVLACVRWLSVSYHSNDVVSFLA